MTEESTGAAQPQFPALDPPPDRAFSLGHLPVREAGVARRWKCVCGRQAVYGSFWWGSMLRETCDRPGVRR